MVRHVPPITSQPADSRPVDPQTVRPQAVFDLNSPEVQWAGALWTWAARGGDLSQCLALLREGVPLPADCAGAFADVIEGRIVPRSTLGGPSQARQARTESRDRQVRMAFDLFLYEEQETFDAPLKRMRTRDQAAEALAEVLSPAMTADQVLKIVNRGNRTRFKFFDELVIQKP